MFIHKFYLIPLYVSTKKYYKYSLSDSFSLSVFTITLFPINVVISYIGDVPHVSINQTKSPINSLHSQKVPRAKYKTPF